ncbi:hypothetical protein D1871_01995 [Nakamurella silvestris]|nr:hypothetical protein D1871_01995 [Nakamurella silvestris]
MLLVGGCVADPVRGSDLATLRPPTLTVSLGSVVETTAGSSVPPTGLVSGSGTSTSTSGTSATVERGPWPESFTGDQVVAAKAALAAFQGYAKVTNLAYRSPGSRDWTAAVQRYAADPESSTLLGSIEGLKQADLHLEGSIDYLDTRIVAADVAHVRVTACVDRSLAHIVDKAGAESVEPPAHLRSLLKIRMSDHGPGIGWRVDQPYGAKGETPC